MDDGNEILRDQFVNLHEADQVEKLYQEWSGAYPNIDLPSTPRKGSLDLGVIRDSEYFFN